jgi:hypothetical protein
MRIKSDEWEEYKAKSPSWYFPIAVAAYRTAMRKSEIINLFSTRLDLKEGFIRLRPEDTKTGCGRSIPIHTDLMEVLRKDSKVRPLNNDHVFLRNGQPVDEN